MAWLGAPIGTAPTRRSDASDHFPGPEMTTESSVPILQIVWHSKTGACRQLARAATAAARDEARIGGAGTCASSTGQARSADGDVSIESHQLAEVGTTTTSPCKDNAGSRTLPGNPAGSALPSSTGLAGGAPARSSSRLPHDTGACSVVIRCDHARRATTGAMLEASGYLFIAPENLASMAGVMKDLFYRQYYPLLDRIQ